jgi:hypothetical protein
MAGMCSPEVMTELPDYGSLTITMKSSISALGSRAISLMQNENNTKSRTTRQLVQNHNT